MFSFFKRKKNNEALQSEEDQSQLKKEVEQPIPSDNEVTQEEETSDLKTDVTVKTITDDVANENAEAITEDHIEPVETLISNNETEKKEESNFVESEEAEPINIKPIQDSTPEQETPFTEPVIEIEKNSQQEETKHLETEPPQKNIEVSEEKLSWAKKLKQGLSKSRNKLGKSLASLFGGGQIDDELYEDLEAVLLSSDMGVEATEYLLKQVRERVTLKGLKDATELKHALEDELLTLVKPLENPLSTELDVKEPFVLMMVGVNGAGKTTSIGKLAKYFQAKKKSVLMAAGDTFRAAAREQIIEWGERNDVAVISQANGDSAAVCFDAVEAAKARHVDIVLADTAGRLPTQLHLMEEIRKVKRVIQKAQESAPHEIILVLDANIGQNAVNQVIAFDDALGLTGLILTKLDGTAKGGIIAALAKIRPIPVRFIGVGEGIDDLRPFVAKDYVDALLND